MRHGKSDWSEGGVSDFNRPLSERGIRDVLQQGQQLLREGHRPDYILSSPAIRAWHTAHLLAQVCSLPHEAVKGIMDFYRERDDAILEALRSLPSEIQAVALIGHNPLWSYLASRWKGETLELSTAEIIGFAWEGEWQAFSGRGVQFAFYLRRMG
ncbi:MAG: histidine phosphatase family protein [Bacteroidia bacterium]|nr:histidine phosphatase family protein [Bacteroidia bacterium]